MKIEKGHYVPKELITSEAIYKLVVMCFEAAGANKNPAWGNYDGKDEGGNDCIIFDIDTGTLIWHKRKDYYYCKHPLTLQELLTAENSIQWPEWAVEIRLNNEGSRPYFKGLNYWCFVDSCDTKSSNGPNPPYTVLATRKLADPLNGYKWGVEYETNGKKPDLADDLIIDRVHYCSGGWFGICLAKDTAWHVVKAFRTVDPRYKPAEEKEKIKIINDGFIIGGNTGSSGLVTTDNVRKEVDTLNKTIPENCNLVYIEELKTIFLKVHDNGQITLADDNTTLVKTLENGKVYKVSDYKAMLKKQERKLFEKQVLSAIQGSAADCDIVLINTLFEAGCRFIENKAPK